MACRLANSSFLFKAPYQRPVNCNKISKLNSSGICHLKFGSFLHGSQKLRWVHHKKETKTIQAIAANPVPNPAPQFSLENAEYRKQLAEQYGFIQIAEPLPENVTLKDIADTLPTEVFEIDEMKAWKMVLFSISTYALGIFFISQSPWYLLPLAWAWTGTTKIGLFVIGHDCGHKLFSKNKLVEDIVGNLTFMPLIFPYESWRFKHNIHHAKTNMLVEDTAWHPILKEDIDSSPLFRKLSVIGYGPFRPMMSLVHWLMFHFDVKTFRPHEVNRVKISLACVFAFMAIGWPLIIYSTGIIGWIKFWLMPWLGFHFLNSIFTMVHHTSPHIPFKASETWNAAQAQLNGTVHCDYHRWMDVLCHYVNTHVPHHITQRIPVYNLRVAHQSLRDNWGKYLNEASCNWRLIKTIMTTCHVYNVAENYASFTDVAPEESHLIEFIRKVMPNYA